MIDQEELLRTYVTNALKAEKPLTVVQLKISAIDDCLRDDRLLNRIINDFHDTLEIYGQAFCLKNDDIFIAYTPKISDNTIKAALIRTWLDFPDVPETEKAEELLERRFKLPQEMDALSYEVSRIAKGPVRKIQQKKERKNSNTRFNAVYDAE